MWRNSAVARTSPSLPPDPITVAVELVPVTVSNGSFGSALGMPWYTPVRPSLHRQVVTSASPSIFLVRLTHPFPMTAYRASTPWIP